MKLLWIILLFISFCPFALANDKLFETPIELKIDSSCKLNEFCEKYIDNIDIEKYLKEIVSSEYTTIDLNRCLDLAILNNFDIQIKEHEYKALKQKYEYEQLKLYMPIFNTTSYIANYQGQILVDGVLRDSFSETAISINLTAQHNLTRGGRDIFEMKSAKYLSKSQKHKENFTKSEVIYKTAKYYYEMLLAKINIEIYLRNLIERNAQLTLAKSLEASGFGTHFDVIRSQNESADAKNKLLHALNQFRMSQSRLANLMGIDISARLVPFESDVTKLNLIDSEMDVTTLFEEAIKYREDLKSLKALVNVERQQKNILITDYIPKPLINFQEQFQGTISNSIKPNYIVAAYMTWQPGEYLSFGTRKKINEQNEKIKLKKLEYENKLRNIEQMLVDNVSTSNYNKQQIEINKKRVEYSNESIKLAMLRFNHGRGILLDIIQAQSEMTTARVQYVASIINYNIAQLEILYNTGTISKEKILENYKP